MSIDFTALDSIGKTTGTPLATDTQQGTIAPTALRELDLVRREQESARRICAVYQENTKKASALLGEILKGLKQGEVLPALFLKAMECLSLLTGDAVVYLQSKEDLYNIYGRGQKDPATLKLELAEVKDRLAMLTRPELINGQTTPEVRQRIKRAIAEHRDLAEQLERDIAQRAN